MFKDFDVTQYIGDFSSEDFILPPPSQYNFEMAPREEDLCIMLRPTQDNFGAATRVESHFITPPRL